MTEDEEQEEVARVRFWIDRLKTFISELDGIDGEKPDDFCDTATGAWKRVASSDAPPQTSPAILLIVETLGALANVMTTAVMDYVTTPDVRDRMTRAAAETSLKKALEAIRRDGERWLVEGMPSREEIQERIGSVGASLKAAQEAMARQVAQDDEHDAAAAADPYGAILLHMDPSRSDAPIFEKMCSFTEAEDTRYRDAYDRIRRMIDCELLQHISDQNKVLCDVLIEVLSDLRDNRISLTDEDAIDERRRRLRSALISFTSALHSHKDQTIRAAREAFGRNMPEVLAVQGLFNDLMTTSFEYRWLVEMRDALLHGDINAFKYNFTARLHGEPAVNVHMDRGYMLQFTREHRNKPWLNRTELQAMASDPSVLDMINAIRPKMGELQEKLDAILYPKVADDVTTVKELIGRFNGRRGMYAMQTGPGFTRRLGIPPFQRLAPRVLAFADGYQGS